MGGLFRFRWLFGVLAVVMLAFAGVYTYNLGVAHGLAESGRFAAPAAAAGAPVVMWWPRPWFGFGFFPFFPLFFILFWFVLLRGLFWRGRWHGYGYGCGGYAYDRVPRAFEEWHRRAHGEAATPPAPDART